MRLLVPQIITFILLIAIPQNLDAKKTGIKMSPALKTITRQAEQTYLIPFGWKIQTSHPKNVATVLGLSMHRQKIYVEQKPEYLDHFSKLVKEIDLFLNNLAKYHGYRDPKDGKHMNANALSKRFYNALMGGMNEWVIKNKHINPAHVKQPLMLNKVTIARKDTLPPDKVPGSTGIFIEKKDPGAIILLDKEVKEEVKDMLDPKNNPPISKKDKTKPLSEKSLNVISHSTQICPDPNDKRYGKYGYYYIDTNNNPGDRTSILCGSQQYNEYIEISQTPIVDSKWHGAILKFKIFTKGKYKGIKYLKEKVDYFNGKKHGDYEEYGLNKSGQSFLRYFSQFNHGNWEGVWKVWSLDKFDRPYLYKVEHYQNGKRHGTKKLYGVSNSGVHYLRGEEMYVNGEQHGEDNGYRENGRRYVQSIYSHGKKIRTTYWDKNGKKWREERWNNGKLISDRRWKNGKRISQ